MKETLIGVCLKSTVGYSLKRRLVFVVTVFRWKIVVFSVNARDVGSMSDLIYSMYSLSFCIFLVFCIICCCVMRVLGLRFPRFLVVCLA